jgi:hypothetical protein
MAQNGLLRHLTTSMLKLNVALTADIWVEFFWLPLYRSLNNSTSQINCCFFAYHEGNIKLTFGLGWAWGRSVFDVARTFFVVDSLVLPVDNSEGPFTFVTEENRIHD